MKRSWAAADVFNGPGKKEMEMREDVELLAAVGGGCVDVFLSDRARGGLDWMETGKERRERLERRVWQGQNRPRSWLGKGGIKALSLFKHGVLKEYKLRIVPNEDPKCSTYASSSV